MSSVNCRKENIAIKINIAAVKKAAEYILNLMNFENASVNLLFTSNKNIRAINKKYLKKDYSTDVIAFPAGVSFAGCEDGDLLGDIVISLEKARSNAREYGATFKNEMLRYVIHGILHLAGYDDKTPKKRKIMSKKEDELLQKIGK